MFSHIRVGTSDIERSRAFYDAVLKTFDVPRLEMNGVLVYRSDGHPYAIGTPLEGEASHANGGTIGFRAASSSDVDMFHAAGVANGGSCAGAPGARDAYGIYAAYLRDPDGNKICAVAPLR